MLERFFPMYRLLFILFLANPAFASNLAKAPPPYTYKTSQAVFVDFSEVELHWEFDVTARTAKGNAVIKFFSGSKGFPIFDLIPQASLKLNGEVVQSSTSQPGNVTTVKVIDKEVEAQSNNTLEVTYVLDSSDVTFTSNAVRFGTFMGDLSDRDFFEHFAPTNLEYDQYKQTLFVSLKGTTTEHEIFTNGFVTTLGGFDFKIDFPAYFTTSSFYFHIAEKGRFKSSSFLYTGLEAVFPVTVYADSSSLVSSGEARTKSVLQELENTFGTFGHDRLVVYITPSGGGMEYCGATMTSLGALGHELTHSWFARGVMPANGNSGWIDEAIASWRDNGYPRRTTEFSNSPINLGNFSVYRRHTTQLAYSSGMQFISYLDGLFSNIGGMKEMLKLLWIEKRRQTITVQIFKDFLQTNSGKDLARPFNFYVLGQGSDQVKQQDTHPRKFTKSELKKFR